MMHEALLAASIRDFTEVTASVTQMSLPFLRQEKGNLKTYIHKTLARYHNLPSLLFQPFLTAFGSLTAAPLRVT